MEFNLKAWSGLSAADDMAPPWERWAAWGLLFVKVALVIGLGIALARLAWLVVAGPGHDVTVAASTQAQSSRASIQVNPDIFRQIDIFRSVGSSRSDQAKPEFADAPDTNLKLVLHGVRLSGQDGGTATISNEQGLQKTYQVGDAIEGLNGVEVERLYPDSILIVRNGKVERLLIRDPSLQALRKVGASDASSDATSTVSDRPTATTASSGRSESQPVRKARRIDVLLSTAEIMQLFQSLSFDGTGLDEGVFVFPVRNSALVSRSGLKAKDIVISISGLQISATTDFERLLADMKDERTSDIELIRADEPLVIRLVRTDG